MMTDDIHRIEGLDPEGFDPNGERNDFNSGGENTGKRGSPRKKKIKEGVDILSMDPNRKPDK